MHYYLAKSNPILEKILNKKNDLSFELDEIIFISANLNIPNNPIVSSITNIFKKS